MQSIYIVKTEHGFNVCVDDHIADSLTPEEVLGTVAEALYGEKARFAKSLAQLREYHRAHGAHLERIKFEERFPALFRQMMAEDNAAIVRGTE